MELHRWTSQWEGRSIHCRLQMLAHKQQVESARQTTSLIATFSGQCDTDLPLNGLLREELIKSVRLNPVTNKVEEFSHRREINREIK